jgi:hypothetical protein
MKRLSSHNFVMIVGIEHPPDLALSPAKASNDRRSTFSDAARHQALKERPFHGLLMIWIPYTIPATSRVWVICADQLGHKVAAY